MFPAVCRNAWAKPVMSEVRLKSTTHKLSIKDPGCLLFEFPKLLPSLPDGAGNRLCSPRQVVREGEVRGSGGARLARLYYAFYYEFQAKRA